MWSDFIACFRVFGKFVNNFERFRKNVFLTRDHFRSIAVLKMEIRRVEMILSSNREKDFFLENKSYSDP